jgi:hypothetical protein
MKEVDINIKIEDYQKCVGCRDHITPKDEQLEAYTILNQCMHMIHKGCLK